jgi:hypothetical protein
MPHVLPVSALQLGHPVPLIVLVKADDSSLHLDGFALLTGQG